MNERRKMTSRFEQIKKQLSGSSTMPAGAAGTANPFMMGSASDSHVHYHDGVACTHDHSHDHSHQDHDHDEHGNCCGHDHDKK